MGNFMRKAVVKMIDIQFVPEENRAIALFEDQVIGYASYIENKGDDVWIIDHTFVDENQRGQGIAVKLVDTVVEEARIRGVKIVPECPYVDNLFKRDPEKYEDLWQR